MSGVEALTDAIKLYALNGGRPVTSSGSSKTSPYSVTGDNTGVDCYMS